MSASWRSSSVISLHCLSPMQEHQTEASPTGFLCLAKRSGHRSQNPTSRCICFYDNPWPELTSVYACVGRWLIWCNACECVSTRRWMLYPCTTSGGMLDVWLAQNLLGRGHCGAHVLRLSLHPHIRPRLSRLNPCTCYLHCTDAQWLLSRHSLFVCKHVPFQNGQTGR